MTRCVAPQAVLPEPGPPGLPAPGHRLQCEGEGGQGGLEGCGGAPLYHHHYLTVKGEQDELQGLSAIGYWYLYRLKVKYK